MTGADIDYSVLHFTAMIQKSSDRVGVGLEQGTNGTSWLRVPQVGGIGPFQ